MKAAIIFESKTGNTKKIAERVKAGVEKAGAEVSFFGKAESFVSADIYFVGSWTDKGSCASYAKEVLKTLKNKKIAYFGTAGFGGSEEYYQKILERVSSNFGEGCELLGGFFCQGKMPMAVRDKYTKMITENPEDKSLKVSIENFDEALKHPDEKDLSNAESWAEKICLGK